MGIFHHKIYRLDPHLQILCLRLNFLILTNFRIYTTSDENEKIHIRVRIIWVFFSSVENNTNSIEEIRHCTRMLQINTLLVIIIQLYFVEYK